MVSRTPKPMMTRRSASDLKNRRPKRNISPKNLDDSVSGLSWKEERELKKALYASLQEARRQSRDDKPDDDESITDSREGMSTSQSRASLSSLTESKFIDENSCSMDSTQSFTEKRDTTRLEAKKTKYHAQRKFAVNSFTPICPEPSTSGVRATRYPSVTHQKKIHAQRKFAQGSTPTTPVEMPSKPKLKVSPIKLFPGRPKTEDFLTYLCFRGTSVLPPHLDLMNVKKDEADGEMSGANGRSGFTRESSPASSSSTSHQNEDSMDVPDVPMRVQTPSRKAARASASTPETARGFVNLRRGGKHSDSKLSPGSRKRLADSYGPSSKLKPKSPIKGHMGDRLTLKRKAMATLTAARRASPKKPEGVKKLRASVSDGELLKRKPESDQNISRKETILEDYENSNECVQVIDKTKSSGEGTENYIDKFSNNDSRIKSQDDKTGSNILLEDSGIHLSFHDHKASVNNDQSEYLKGLDDKASFDSDPSVYLKCLNNESQTCKIGENRYFSEIAADFKQSKLSNITDIETETELSEMLTFGKENDNLKRSKRILSLGANELYDPNYMSCASLLKPLESELDESIDILPETDISLNESLDVTEILSVGETSLGLLSPEVKRAHSFAKTEAPQEDGHQLFKPSFELLPKQGKNVLKVTKVMTRSAAKNMTLVKSLNAENLNLSLSDHSYSKIKKYVRFQIKSKHSKSVQPLSSSTPRPMELTYHAKSQSRPKSTKSKKLKLTQHNRKRDSECKGNHTPKSNGMRKRKSTGDLNENCMPSTPKRNKIENGSRFKSVLKCRAKETRGISNNKLKYLNSLETHPKKRLATSLRVKKTFKPHKPITRATTHLKQALKCAKMAANKKLKFVSKALQSGKSKRLTETSRRNGSEKKKLSSESSGSRSSLSSFSSDNSGEIRIKTDRFPGDSDPAAVVQCPTYYPSEEQFRDPILYIQSIQSEAEQYGMCKIVPPCNWKMDSRELDDIRFTTKIQFIHKMLHKWSPITEQLEYIKRLHNDAATNDEFQVPQIGGVEIDLVKLYELVQKYGGMKGTVGKEKKWLKIAEAMKIPKQADRVSKLYAAYCKYLLAYETLSEEETEQLQETVQTDRKKDEAEKHIPTCYKCVYKGKSQPLSSFHRAARNTQQLYDPESCNDPETIENDYWDIVEKSDDHVAVQGASLDTSIHGSMFPVRRDNMYARHGWNLHNFVESKGSILHHLGLIAGVTVPTLHIGMLYTTKCLSCNGHNLPTVQYLHQGPGLVWYAVPSQETDNLKEALKTVAPKLYRKEGFCLQKNSAMIPQSKLVENGVSLSRCVQTEREFVVVFPSVNYSNISLGYNMSESVHYGTQDWIPEGYQASKNLGMNHDIELFSMDAMLVFLARDSTTQDTTLALLLPYLEKVVEREITERKKLFEAGLKETEQLHDKLEKQAQKTDVLEEIIICDVSNKICYLSMVLNSHENSAFSLEQGLLHIQKRKNLKYCKLMYRYSEEELKALVKEVKSRLRGGNSSSPGASTSSPKRKTRKSNSDIKSSPASSTSSR
ncbi:protein Jumonji-like isoform X2 [Ruditapes philippinarum]|uniref:protein Jumonji-like isoform X2 n=1 Tax=Ruditapes philippinarum TaxID=129788 RepID=UPI00295C166D|nr:protein Jumonji-like isoform X2 [Ruditapes philippinarum]